MAEKRADLKLTCDVWTWTREYSHRLPQKGRNSGCLVTTLCVFSVTQHYGTVPNHPLLCDCHPRCSLPCAVSICGVGGWQGGWAAVSICTGGGGECASGESVLSWHPKKTKVKKVLPNNRRDLSRLLLIIDTSSTAHGFSLQPARGFLANIDAAHCLKPAVLGRGFQFSRGEHSTRTHLDSNLKASSTTKILLARAFYLIIC